MSLARTRSLSRLARSALVAAAAFVLLTGLSGADGEAPSVRPAAVSSAVVWAVGDGANGSDPAKAVARRIGRDEPRRFLYLGDVYEHGTRADFRNHYRPVYGHLNQITAPTPGNHEWARRGEGYDPYWRGVRGRRQPYRYSFSLAGWQIISLNSEGDHDWDSSQVRWLRNQLRGDRTCRLAFWHAPRYTAGPHGDDRGLEPFWDALEGRARIVLNGHEHNMQRFPRYRGITQLISGAGGAELHGTDPDDRRPAFRDATHYGALRLVLRPGSASFRFVTRGGRTLDSGTVSCRS